MKIGFDAKRLFRNFTGLGNYSRTLLRHLAEFYPENEYHLFTPALSDHAEVLPFLENERYKVHRPAGGNGAYWRSFGVKKDLKKSGIELFHGLSHELPFGIQKTGIRTVVTIHDLIFKTNPEFFPWVDRQLYDLKFAYACRKADAVIAISESTKRDIVRFYKIPEKKIVVIYQTCHERFYEKTDEATRRAILKENDIPSEFLLYVGAVNERKNLLRLVQAIELLPKNLQLPLIVVGNGGAYKKKVEQYIAEKKLGHLVRFFPKMNFAHLPAIYQSAQMLVYPSFYEGFGIPIIEALYSSIPVITSPFSSLPEAGGPGALYIDPTEPADLADGIRQLLEDSALRQDLITKGGTFVQKFGKAEVTGAVMNLYKKVLENGKF
ncbi:MAG TPA: glycosyltransferase family 1 protein [Saprospiraceae bacterium]|nr:glycosyltransferase family 1 protein [Saprospiraceae bacterium]